MIITRFAPSPTGHLHLGHAYSAWFAWHQAEREQGRFLLRIEDIDPVRCKPDLASDLIEDLHCLGLVWPEPVRYQAQHMGDYAAALDVLRAKNLIYPCFCTRREVVAEAMAAGHAPHEGEDVLYAGTCRHLTAEQRQTRMQQIGVANWRLDVGKAIEMVGAQRWHDRDKGWIEATPQQFGDVVLARKDVPTSYHLSVTVDDHLQGVTLVTRGQDLFTATHIHRLLQALLGYETPDYHHHGLLMDETGRRYAKRDKSVTLRSLRQQGKTPDDIYALIGVSR